METKSNTKDGERALQLDLFFEQQKDCSSILLKKNDDNQFENLKSCELVSETKVIDFTKVVENKINQQHQKTINYILNNVRRF
ncbi:hypothetical protein [Myroides odoratimimus]|uniref:hypothetical protein n=1 Tax=Myroides odoratimimus TaxID=76832 RepID=UPI002DBC191D|nr:hypothetical protein [Myroides odoratimimus]MEC4041898.1 hypothetical protein [Myroides odoratimimus]MEC4149870.1 hypothetical protein [Myroides odoratimimus]